VTVLLPISLREARGFVAEHHRHNGPPQGWLFGVGAYADELVGVGIAGRPIGRKMQDGRTVEITRLCLSQAPRNTASRLYGALCRAAKALGYLRAITYTLQSEAGTSLAAAGFRPVAELAARAAWTEAEGVNRQQRDIFGVERRPTEAKIRWERSLA
jgi:hypothetical protein